MRDISTNEVNNLIYQLSLNARLQPKMCVLDNNKPAANSAFFILPTDPVGLEANHLIINFNE